MSDIRVQKPWGFYEMLLQDNRYKVKRLVITPGKRTSRQRHLHRSEVWTVVQGLIDDDGKQYGEGETATIQAGEWHEIYNPGKIAAIVIEVQYGSYCEEDDIERKSEKQPDRQCVEIR